MRYTIRRISLASALRVGCTLGWLIALCPAIALAVLVGQIIQRVDRALGGIAPFQITVWDQPIARIDFLETLNLRETATTVSDLASNLGSTLLLVALALIVLGTIAVALTVALFCFGYNLLAGLGGGLSVELQSDPRDERRG